MKNMETDEGKDGLLTRGSQVLDGKERDHLRDAVSCASDFSSPDEHIHLKDSSVTRVGIQDSDSLNWSEIYLAMTMFSQLQNHMSEWKILGKM